MARQGPGGAQPKARPCMGKEPPREVLQPGPDHQKAALQEGARGGRGTPTVCGGQVEHKSAVRPCGSWA